MIKKSRSSIKAQAAAFEVRVKRDINNEPDCFAIKVPESIKGVFGKGKPILAKTECDFAALIVKRMAVFDCKERDKDKFYIKEICLNKKSCHQFFFMKEAYEKGAISGYLCHFKPLGVIAWVDIYRIKEALKNDKTVVEIEDLPKYSVQPYNQRIDIKKLMGLM